MPAVVTNGGLVLGLDGAIISSSGSLSNDENVAKTLYLLIQMASSLNKEESVAEFSVSFGDHRYVACTSNKKIHISKVQNDQ